MDPADADQDSRHSVWNEIGLVRMSIIAEYCYSRGWAMVRFTLYSDRIVIKSKSRLGVFTEPAQLSTLRGVHPVPVVSMERSPGFVLGGFVSLAAFGLGCAWLLSGGLKVGFGFPVAMSCVAVFGILWAWFGSRRWNVARFYSDAGVFAFAVRCPSEEAATLDGFITSVVSQIRALHPEAKPARMSVRP